LHFLVTRTFWSHTTPIEQGLCSWILRLLCSGNLGEWAVEDSERILDTWEDSDIT